MSLQTKDQDYLDRTEVETALEFADIAANYGVPVTLFVTGMALEEEREKVAELAARENVELGGHNYHAFDTAVHKGWRLVEKVTLGAIGSWNGPRSYQEAEINRTKEAFSEIGVSPTSWRDHAYRHDTYTPELLAENGFTHFSDDVNPEGEVSATGVITSVPINTPPDHEHVYHAFRTPEFVEQDDFEGPFGTESRSIDDWREWVLSETASHVAVGRIATVLAHPACMYLADGFEAFERLCEHVSAEHEPIMMSSITR